MIYPIFLEIYWIIDILGIHIILGIEILGIENLSTNQLLREIYYLIEFNFDTFLSYIIS